MAEKFDGAAGRTSCVVALAAEGADSPTPLKAVTRVAPVQADEVTPANARSKAQLLLEEIEQDN